MIINGKRYITICCMAEPIKEMVQDFSEEYEAIGDRVIYSCSKCQGYDVKLQEAPIQNQDDGKETAPYDY